MKRDSNRWVEYNSKWLSFVPCCCAKIPCPKFLKGERLLYSSGLKAQSIVEGESDSRNLKELNTTISIWKRAVCACAPGLSPFPPRSLRMAHSQRGRLYPLINLIKIIPHRFIQRPDFQVRQNFFCQVDNMNPYTMDTCKRLMIMMEREKGSHEK